MVCVFDCRLRSVRLCFDTVSLIKIVILGLVPRIHNHLIQKFNFELCFVMDHTHVVSHARRTMGRMTESLSLWIGIRGKFSGPEMGNG